MEQEGRAGEFGSSKGNEKELKADPFVIDLYRMFVPLFIYCKFCMNSKFFIVILRLIFRWEQEPLKNEHKL